MWSCVLNRFRFSAALIRLAHRHDRKFKLRQHPRHTAACEAAFNSRRCAPISRALMRLDQQR